MKKILCAAMIMCLMANPVQAFAAENTMEKANPVKVSGTEVSIDKETGEFSFDVTVDTQEAFAGMEFGVICSEGCEVTEVAYNVDAASAAPTKAAGVTWFGFFNGEDSYIEDIVATINGKCDSENEAAVAFQVVKRYTIGEEEYAVEQIPLDIVVSLGAEENPLTELENIVDLGTENVNAGFIVAGCIAAGVIVITAFIYIRITKKKKNEETK